MSCPTEVGMVRCLRHRHHGATERIRNFSTGGQVRQIRNQTANERHQVRAYWSEIVMGTQGLGSGNRAEFFNNSCRLSNFCVVGTMAA